MFSTLTQSTGGEKEVWLVLEKVWQISRQPTKSLPCNQKLFFSETQKAERITEELRKL